MDSSVTPPSSGDTVPQPTWWLRALCRLPLGALYGICGVLVLVARYGLRYRVRVAHENLRACFPEWSERELRRVLNGHFRNQGQVLAEALNMGSISAAELRERVDLSEFAPMREQLHSGQAVLCVTAHFGNWEWLLQAVGVGIGAPVFGAYKPPRGAAADRAVLWLRGRFGVHMVPAKRLLRALARERGHAHVVGIVADQVPTSSGGRLWLSFLNRETAFFPGPAEIARVCRYESYFVAMRRTARGHYRPHVVPLAAAGETLTTAQYLARYAKLLEAEVRAAPAEWGWTHRRWKLTRRDDEPLQSGSAPG